MGVRGQLVGSQFSSFFMWVLRMELSCSDLTVTQFTCLALSQAPVASFITKLNVSCYTSVLLQVSKSSPRMEPEPREAVFPSPAIPAQSHL